jgi:hypothetical protein
LPVAGGGTGATTLTGVLIGMGTTAVTVKTNPSGAFLDDSTAQNISGAKTFANTTLALRNPANTFTGTLTNPVYTATTAWELEGPFSYIIYKTGTTIKLMNMVTRGIVSSGTTADVVIQAGIDALGNDSTKSIYIKGSGLYTLTAALNFTAINGYCNIVGESAWTQLRPSGNFPAITISGKTGVNLSNLYMVHNQPGYTSNLLNIAGSSSCKFSNLHFYDADQHVGNAIGLDSTSASCFRNIFEKCYTYGFNNAIFANVPNTSFFCNGNYFDKLWLWNPIRGLSLNTAASSGFDNNNMNLVQIQAKTNAPNQTECGFDYETNLAGHAWYTSHTGCMVWDLASSKQYGLAPAGNLLNIDCHGCMPAYKWGGAGATAGHIRVFDNESVNRGKSTQSGNASTKVFNIAHGLFAAPSRANVTAGSSDALGTPAVTFDSTNVILTYPTPPPSGTNNLVWNWEATIF